MDTFHEEAALPPSDRATLQDYARSGYDRGHMAPNGDMDNPEAQGQSFTLANMIPQKPSNNRGIWNDIEVATRNLALQYGDVWVVTIPVFAAGQTLWLRDRVAIPAKIAKAMYIPSLNAASAYITDNADRSSWRIVSMAQLGQLTGIDPFPALPIAVKQTPVQLPAPGEHALRGRERADSLPFDGGSSRRSPADAGSIYPLLKSFIR